MLSCVSCCIVALTTLVGATFRTDLENGALHLDECRVLVTPEKDGEALAMKAYFGLLSTENKQVLIVLITERNCVGRMRVKARFQDIEITEDRGYSLPLNAGGTALIIRCEDYDKLKAALMKRYGLPGPNDRPMDRQVEVTVSILAWKVAPHVPRSKENVKDGGETSGSRSPYGESPQTPGSRAPEKKTDTGNR